MTMQRLFELFLPTLLAVGGVVYSTSQQTAVLVERIDSLIKVINKHDSEIDDLKRKVVENSIRLGVIDEKLRDRKGV
jgi:hypothetical protein